MALSNETATGLRDVHDRVQSLTEARRKVAQHRTEIARKAQAEGATVSEIQALLGLSRTGVVKILNGSRVLDDRQNGSSD